MNCPTGWLIEQVGDRWILHLLHHLSNRPHRTLALLENLKGISSRTLSAKLKRLEADGWINRRVFAEVPPRVEYELSDQGRGLLPVLEVLTRIGDSLSPLEGTDCPSCVNRGLDGHERLDAPIHPTLPEREVRAPSYSRPDDDVILL